MYCHCFQYPPITLLGFFFSILYRSDIYRDGTSISIRLRVHAALQSQVLLVECERPTDRGGRCVRMQFGPRPKRFSVDSKRMSARDMADVLIERGLTVIDELTALYSHGDILTCGELLGLYVTKQ
ncbi:uncharacterized protein LOC110834963 isoform X2 [Zootermopsis nevadensis]|uniref:uncharacterized protein LOC110834963 isoform X2 n=1 Tax=Zootermopsis nevadensis TaxID=136037 RepID=UPI000B8E5E49|nr:uncharacterized protein LOC110834963 isoform X2 [Zootermopsis nevadensis]